MNNLETEIKAILCADVDDCLPWLNGEQKLYPDCAAKDSIACPISNDSIRNIVALFADLEAKLALAEKKLKRALLYTERCPFDENDMRYASDVTGDTCNHCIHISCRSHDTKAKCLEKMMENDSLFNEDGSLK